MKRKLLLAVAFFLLAVSGALHGVWTGRWGPSADLEAAAARCEALAMNLGDWEGQPGEIDPRQLAVAEVVGHVSRRYVNRLTGQTVSVLLICGRPGPISVHTPDVCYKGSGFSMVGKQEQQRLEPNAAGPAATFWTARFSKPGVNPQPLRVFWGWRATGAWSASDDVRLRFARSGFLYKLYVVRSLASTDESLEEDPGLDLLRVLLPELERCLSPGSGPA